MSVTSPLCWRAPHFSWVLLLSCLFPCLCSSSLFSVFHLEQPPVAHNLAQRVHCPRPHLFQGLSPLGLESFAASLTFCIILFCACSENCGFLLHSFRMPCYLSQFWAYWWHSFFFFSNVDTDLLFSNTSLLLPLGIWGRRKSLQPILNLSTYPCTQQPLFPLGPDFHGWVGS